MNQLGNQDILFDIEDIFGKKLRSTASDWKRIREEKHTDLEYEIGEVIKTLETPDEVRRSVTDSTIMLYYKQFKPANTLLVAAKHLNGHGFVVTVYQTTKSKKKGEKLWPKI